MKKDEHGKEIKAEAKDEKKVESNIDFGETYKMQTFNLNLGGMENRYIRIEISLEYKGGAEQKKEMEVRLPQLRDAIIGILQRKTREFLLSPDGKESLRKELLIRINRYMTKKIESVYITDLLIE
ncbi:MAG: flagellar basal body-associated FliL family protein [Proteobacteria bacterium]|nr:MAG: flagellar basal body-associated FliL family protein [Pseudomonadota bacterium]